MKSILILSMGLFALTSFASGIDITYTCGARKTVSLSLSQSGEVIFTPEAPLKSECSMSFRESVWRELNTFKEKNCEGSEDPICTGSTRIISEKISAKIDYLLKLDKEVPKDPPQVIEEPKISTDIPKSENEKVSTDKMSEKDMERNLADLPREEAKQFLQDYMVTKADVLKDPNHPERVKVMGELENMFAEVYGSEAEIELKKSLKECTPPDQTFSPIKDILKGLLSTRKVLNCAPVNPGEHKVFQKDMKNYSSTGNYLLKRLNNGTYQVVLNVNFKQVSGGVSAEAMLNRAKACLDEASPYMKGPNNEQMGIAVISPEEAQKLPSGERPNPYTITIEGPSHTSHSLAYNQDVNCSVITHEMLHLLGLCDEYKETRAEFAKYQNNCRIVTKVPSIMRDLGVYEKATGGSLTCDCTTPTCSSVMRSSDRNLQKMYMSENVYEMTDYRFRSNYCKVEYLFNRKPASTSKGSTITANDEDSIVIESRAVDSLSVQPFYRINHIKLTCSCPSGDSDCLEKKNQLAKKVSSGDLSRSECPSGAPLMKKDKKVSSNGVSFNGRDLSFNVRPKLPSLLQPNHFNKILEGNCAGKADGYRECAQYSYKSPPCDVPERCSDDGYYLGSSK